MIPSIRRAVFIAAATALSMAGCSRSSQPRPLAPQAFYPGSTYEGTRSGAAEPRIPEDPRSEIDQSQKTSGVTFPKPRKPEPLPPPNVHPATQANTASATNTTPATRLQPGQ